MRASAILTPLALLAAALSGCGGESGDPQSNAAAEAAAPAEIEALPPDESAATPTEDLVDGTVEPPAGDNQLVAPEASEPQD